MKLVGVERPMKSNVAMNPVCAHTYEYYRDIWVIHFLRRMHWNLRKQKFKDNILDPGP